MIIENIMSAKFSALKISDSEDTACQLMVEAGTSYLPVIGDAGEPLGVIWQTDLFQKLLPIADNRLIGIVAPRNFLGITIDLLQDREELKFDDLDEDAEIGALDEDDLGDIFVDEPETEDWNQMDV